MFPLISLFFKSKLKSFFKSKYFIYSLVVLFILSCFYFTYKTGFNNGKEQEKIRLDKEYKTILEKRIKENEEVLKREFDIILQNQEEKIRYKNIYIEKEKIVEKIIKESPILNNEMCVMSEEELKQFNELKRRP